MDSDNYSNNSCHSNNSFWNKLTKVIKKSNQKSSESINSDDSSTHSDASSQKRQRKQLKYDTAAPPMLIPPFSPTYCKDNEFPYSNFYIKLPDGRWMIKYRDGNREVLRTDIMEGYMI